MVRFLFSSARSQFTSSFNERTQRMNSKVNDQFERTDETENQLVFQLFNFYLIYSFLILYLIFSVLTLIYNKLYVLLKNFRR